MISDLKGNPEPDPDLRDNENVPLPAVPVSFVENPTERFSTLEYVPPRPLAEIDAELKALEAEIQQFLAEVAG